MKINATVISLCAVLLLILGYSGLFSEQPSTQDQNHSAREQKQTGTEKKKTPLYTILIDYLPNFVYDDEKITAVLRVVNNSDSELNGRLIVVRKIIAGSETGKIQKKVAIKRGEENQYTFNIDLSALNKKIRFISIQMKIGEGNPKEEHEIRILGYNEKLLPYSLKDGSHFVLKTGKRVIFEIEHMKFVQKRKWVFAKWLQKRLTASRRYNSFLFLGAPLCRSGELKDSYLQMIRHDLSPMDIVKFVDFPETGAYPILENAVRFKAAVDIHKKDRAVLFLPYSDLIYGTGKREYRMCCEFMLQRLFQAGYAYRDILIVTPAVPERLSEKFKPYTEVLGKIARIYYIPIKVSEDLRKNRWWSVEEDNDSVYGRYPNTKGHFVIGEYLKNEIR
jgi:hypothetical protein